MPVSTIHVLPENEIYLVRKISLFDKSDRRKQPIMGTLIYARRFDKIRNYIMHPHPMDQFNRCVYGYKEDEYPHDILDDLILDTMRNLFPKAERKSEILMFNVDKDKYEYIRVNYKKTEIKLMVSESLKLLEDGKSRNVVDALWFPLNIYSLSKWDYDCFNRIGTVFAELSAEQSFNEIEDLCTTSYFSLPQMLNV